MKPFLRGRWLHFGALSVLCALLSCALWRGDNFSAQPLMRATDNALFDIAFRARGPISPAAVEAQSNTRDIVLIETTHQLPRPLLARLINKLRLARVVALDFMLVDDQQSFAPEEAQWFAPEIARWQRETAILARAVKTHGRVILASWPEEISTNFNAEGSNIATQQRFATVWRRPPAVLWNATRWHAHVVVEGDDAIARRVKLWQSIDNSPNTSLPCMGLAMAALSQHQSAAQWWKQHPLATDENGTLPINWLGGREVFGQLSNSIGYTQVLDLWEAEDFRDRVVIIGEVSRQAKEIAQTPWGEAPAMQTHANVFATLLDPRGTLKLPTLPTLFLISVVLCYGVCWPVLRWPLWTSFVMAGAVSLGVVGGVIWDLGARQTLWPGSVPLLAIVLCANGVALYEYWRTRHTLGRFVGREMLGRALHPRRDLQPGGAEEVATAMFCDLRGYSTLAETMTPMQITKLINDYSSLLLRIVPQFGGRAVDYQGDGVFILFESALAGSEHAVQGVRAALSIQDEFRVFKRLWRERLGRELELGIGLESGPMMIGILGSRDRLHLGAVGDAVNVAARVQSLTQELNASIIVTSHVYELLGDSQPEFQIQARGQRLVKGRSQLVELYAVLGWTRD